MWKPSRCCCLSVAASAMRKPPKLLEGLIIQHEEVQKSAKTEKIKGRSHRGISLEGFRWDWFAEYISFSSEIWVEGGKVCKRVLSPLPTL